MSHARQDWGALSAILIMMRRRPSPRLGSWSLLDARGMWSKTLPLLRDTGRAGKLPRGPFAGLLVLAECSPPRAPRCAASPPRNWPRAAASRRFPPFPVRPGQMSPGRRVACLGRCDPSGCGAYARIDSASGGPDAAHAGGASPAPACVRVFAARIRPPHPSESACSAPGRRGLRVLHSCPRRPTGRRGENPPHSSTRLSPKRPVSHRNL